MEWGQGSKDQLETHRNDGLEVVWIERGHLNWQIDGQAIDIVPDTLLFTWPWESHGSRHEWEPGHAWRYFVIRVSGTDLTTVGLDSSIPLPTDEVRELVQVLSQVQDRRIMVDARLRAGLEWLTEVLKDSNSSPRQVARIVAALLHDVRIRYSESPEGAFLIDEEADRVTARVMAVLQRNLGREWTLVRLGKAVGLQRTRLTELVGRSAGESPMRLLRRLRLEAARERLASGDDSVTALASELGFGTPQQFGAAFRALYGVPPTTYRRRLRSGETPDEIEDSAIE